jgi:hypothetical protein
MQPRRSRSKAVRIIRTIQCGRAINFTKILDGASCDTEKVKNTYNLRVIFEMPDKSKAHLDAAVDVCDQTMFDIGPGTPLLDDNFKAIEEAHGAVPACDSAEGEPVLRFRNMIQGTKVTGIYVAPVTSAKGVGGQTTFTSKLWYSNMVPTIAKEKGIKGIDPKLVLDPEANPIAACGVATKLSGWVGKVTCTGNKLSDSYNVRFVLDTPIGEKQIDQTVNVCDQTIVDLWPKTPLSDKTRF